MLAAVTLAAVRVEYDVVPLTADSLTPRQGATVDDAAATDACSQDDAEDGGAPWPAPRRASAKAKQLASFASSTRQPRLLTHFQ